MKHNYDYLDRRSPRTREERKHLRETPDGINHSKAYRAAADSCFIRLDPIRRETRNRMNAALDTENK